MLGYLSAGTYFCICTRTGQHHTKQKLSNIFRRKGVRVLLSEGPRRKQLGDEVEIMGINIDPGSVETNDGLVVESAEKMNLRVEPL